MRSDPVRGDGHRLGFLLGLGPAGGVGLMPWRNLQTSAPRYKVTCDVCGLEGWNTDENLAHEVRGWVAPRKGGGANHIRLQTKTGRYRHKACLGEEAMDPITTAVQESLFNPE